MCYLGVSWCCCQLRDEERCTVNWEKHTFVGMFNYWYNTLRFCFQALSHWFLAMLNNQYKVAASGVIQECCEKYMENYDKDGVITVNIYLYQCEVENLIVLGRCNSNFESAFSFMDWCLGGRQQPVPTTVPNNSKLYLHKVPAIDGLNHNKSSKLDDPASANKKCTAS